MEDVQTLNHGTWEDWKQFYRTRGQMESGLDGARMMLRRKEDRDQKVPPQSLVTFKAEMALAALKDSQTLTQLAEIRRPPEAEPAHLLPLERLQAADTQHGSGLAVHW